MKSRDLLYLGPIPFFAIGIACIMLNETLGFAIILAASLWHFLAWLGCLGAAIRMEYEGNERMLWILAILFINLIGMYLFYFKVLRSESLHSSVDSNDANTIQDIKNNYGSVKKHPLYKEYLSEDPSRKYQESKDLISNFISWIQTKNLSNQSPNTTPTSAPR